MVVPSVSTRPFSPGRRLDGEGIINEDLPETEKSKMMTASIPSQQKHIVYMVQCIDGSLYTGYTTNVERRVHLHNAGKGARYTRSRRPVTLLASWSFPTKGEALRTERSIKQLPRAQKLHLINSSKCCIRGDQQKSEDAESQESTKADADLALGKRNMRISVDKRDEPS